MSSFPAPPGISVPNHPVASENRWVIAEPLILLLRILTIVLLAAFAAYYVVVSLHWPLLDDSPVMHYVSFLMAHGLHPYRDISDTNMPGAYLSETLAMHLFGPSDLAWRFYDFSLCLVLGLSAIVIARPYDWFAGYLGAGLFLLVHAADGPRVAGEREQLIAVLIMVGYALLFLAIRHLRPSLMLPFGVVMGLAASIKPTFAGLGLALLLLTFLILRRRRVPPARYIAFGLLGISSVALVMLGFLLHHQVLGQFLFLQRLMTPAYAALRHPTLGYLLYQIFPLTLLPLLPLAAALVLLRHTRGTWEQGALLLGAGMGLLSYFIQRKGFYHHRYTWLALILLLCAIELSLALRRPGWSRRTALAALLLVSLGCVPRYINILNHADIDNTLALKLQSDLTVLQSIAPGRTLDRQVMCFDLVSGCLNALYHMQLVEDFGFTGDLLLFRETDTPAVRYAHDLYRRNVSLHPPGILVLGNEWFAEKRTFAKFDTWPEFADQLRSNYTQVAAREFPLRHAGPEFAAEEPPAYRIYIRNGTPILASVQQHLLP